MAVGGLAAASGVLVLPAAMDSTLVFPRPLGAGHKADRTAAAAVRERGKSLPTLGVDVLVLKYDNEQRIGYA